MAAVAELSVLLFALINNLHAEERILIRRERGSYTFDLPKEADSCLISRFVGEEKLVLWNTSDPRTENSTLPEDLKRRLSVVSWENISYYRINKMTHSDSGPYQEKCWTDGNVTHEKNVSITVCSFIDQMNYFKVRRGETADLLCEGAADNLDVQWLKRDFKYGQEVWTRVFGDNTSVMEKGRYQMEKNTSALRVSNFTTADIGWYTCVAMKQQQCVSNHPVEYHLDTQTMYRSVGEAAVLPCTVTESSEDEPPRWYHLGSNDDRGQENQTDQNYSRVFPLLTLNHSGEYTCLTSVGSETYLLVVCPKFGPPALELFSEGQDVTLRCKDREKGREHVWFIKSNRTQGRVFHVFSNLSLSRASWYHHDGTLVISNVSLTDSGEYWCAVLDPGDLCMSTTRTLLQYRDPFGVHSTFYKVRCSVLSVLLLVLCAVVVAVNQWARRAEHS